jgi:hypothetical protein
VRVGLPTEVYGVADSSFDILKGLLSLFLFHNAQKISCKIKFSILHPCISLHLEIYK